MLYLFSIVYRDACIRELEKAQKQSNFLIHESLGKFKKKKTKSNFLLYESFGKLKKRKEQK